MMKTTRTLLGSLALATSLSLGNAALIITPNTPTGNVAPNAGSSYASLVNSSGLSDTVSTGTTTAYALTVSQTTTDTDDTYVTPSTGSGTNYFDAGGTIPVLTFALGGTYDDVNSIIVWNYRQEPNSTTEFSLAFYSDAAATTQIGSTISGLTLTAGGSPTSAQQVFFGGGGTLQFDGVQAIVMTLTDNAQVAGSNRVGLGEVRFSQVPEPSQIAMLAVGLCGVLFFRRRNVSAL